MLVAKNKQANLKKKDIVKDIFTNIGISSLYSNKIVNDIINIIIFYLKSNKEIKIKNFGVFKLQKKIKRIGRNPKNREEFIISRRTVTTFKTADNLKRRINKNV
tara:strand:- start:425 stop:736 length:312 start_codon:yes stop_codon:yes gene_type:complete